MELEYISKMILYMSELEKILNWIHVRKWLILGLTLIKVIKFEVQITIKEEEKTRANEYPTLKRQRIRSNSLLSKNKI